jgi:threonine/homoserine/homoserine lactone efflux protein
MSLETYFAFTTATLVLLVVPGPTILLVVSYGLGQGWRAALPTAIGVALGDFTAMTLSLFGVGALLAASATLFTALKWTGAAYLIYLGFKLFRADGAPHLRPVSKSVSTAMMIGHAWVVTALNPKSITFFVAFVPQFVDHTLPFLQQALIFETTFLVLAFGNAFAYGFFASRAREKLANPRMIRVINRAGGALLMGAGAAAVATRN